MVRRKSEARSQKHSRPPSQISSTQTLVTKQRRGFRALQEIKHLRNSVNLLIPKASFARLVREILTDLFPRKNVTRLQSVALLALQEAAEAYLVQFFEDCVLLTLHAKRVTLHIHDMVLLRRLRGRGDIINK